MYIYNIYIYMYVCILKMKIVVLKNWTWETFSLGMLTSSNDHIALWQGMLVSSAYN
jgi:hypothetical protein